MAPQMGSQKDDSEIQEMAMLPPSTTRRTSCLRLQIEGDDKQSRRVTFAPGTKEMSENTKAPVSTPTKKRNTWNPALGWKIDPSVKLSFDVVDLYRGPRLGELATYANSYYQQKRRPSSTSTSSSSSRFQSDGMNVNVVDTCPLKRSQNSTRIQSEKLSDFDGDANITKEMDMDAFPLPRVQGSPRLQSEKLSSDLDATSANDDIDMDTYPLPRMHGNSRLQSEKLSDSMAGSSSSPLKHRRTCRSNQPSPDDIILLTTNMDIENQPPSPPPVVYNHQDIIHEYHQENNHQDDENNQQNNSLLLVNMNMMNTSQKQSDIRNCFDQTMRSTTPSSSSKCDVLLPTMISETTTKNITTTSTLPIHLPTTIDTIITNLIKPPSKNHIVDDDTMFFFHSSTSLTFPGSNRSMKRPRSTVLAYRCFVCFFCAFLFSFLFSY